MKAEVGGSGAILKGGFAGVDGGCRGFAGYITIE